MDYKNKLYKIIKKHGISNQLKKLSEEIFELQESIINYMDCGYIDGTEHLDHITEEFADVMVLLNQIKEVYRLDEDEIMNIMKLKIDRQCKRDDIDAGNS